MVLISIFLMTEEMVDIFSCAIGHLHIFEETSVQVLHPRLNRWLGEPALTGRTDNSMGGHSTRSTPWRRIWIPKASTVKRKVIMRQRGSCWDADAGSSVGLQGPRKAPGYSLSLTLSQGQCGPVSISPCTSAPAARARPLLPPTPSC